jgi:hypothetical protein
MDIAGTCTVIDRGSVGSQCREGSVIPDFRGWQDSITLHAMMLFAPISSAVAKDFDSSNDRMLQILQ